MRHDATYVIVAAVLVTISAATPRAEAETIESVLYSLNNGDRDSSWSDLFQSAGWDTLDQGAWLPDPDLSASRTPSWRRLRMGLRPAMRFNKVDGYIAGFGPSIQWMGHPGLHLYGTMSRSSGRGRYQGETVASWQSDVRAPLSYSWGSQTRLAGGGKESSTRSPRKLRRGGRSWSILSGYSERSVPFGGNRPIANAGLSLYLALDEQSYLDRIEGFVGARLGVGRSVRSELVYLDRRDRPIRNSRSPQFNTSPQTWKNAPSERQHVQGVIWIGEWLRRSGRSGSHEGIWWKASAWGGKLGGDREFYTAGIEGRRSFLAPGSGTMEWEGALSIVGGDPALQDLADLGGSTSLRAYAPRSAVGTTSLFFRTNYSFGTDLLAKTEIRGMRSLHLQPVLFFDIGAAWGRQGWRSVSDLTLPESRQWKSDVGIGFQRRVNYPGLLQHVRLDLAWRLDRSRDRFRASVTVAR